MDVRFAISCTTTPDADQNDASPREVPVDVDGGHIGLESSIGEAGSGTPETDTPDEEGADAATEGGQEAGSCRLDQGICEFYDPWRCVSGEVDAIVDPCEFCGPSFWEPVLRCERGCRVDLDAVTSTIEADGTWAWALGGPEDLCEENRPKDAGDP